MSKRSAWWLLLFASCGAPLPSTTPLGEGPRVAVEAKQRAKEDEALEEKRASTDAGSGASGQSASAVPPPEAKDAGAVDAGAGADAGAKEATADAGSSSSPQASVAVVLAGLYVGHDESTFRLAGMPEKTEKDPKAKTRVVDNADGSIDLFAIDSSNGKDICTLHAKPDGKGRKTFTVAAGQHCFESGAGMSATLTKGTAKLDAGKLVLDLSFDLEVKNQDFELGGSLEYHFEGDKN